MNIIRMSGGLERQMFQYALYLKLTSMGREVKMDDVTENGVDKTKPIMLSVFDIQYPSATKEEIWFLRGHKGCDKRLRRKAFHDSKQRIYEEDGFYDPKVLEQDDMYLDGKFMSQKYFEDILSQVKETYKFPSIENLSLTPRANENFLIYYDAITRSNAVGIHIRRSDSRYNEELYQNICTTEYYHGAISYILERVPDAKFFVFSNEPKWIKSWIKEILRSFINDDMSDDEIRALRERCVLVEANDEYTSYLDMFLLSKCQHNILSNSSFSWWGAWINENPNQMIVAPSTWLNGVDSNDLYTEGMVLINSKGRVDHKVK